MAMWLAGPQHPKGRRGRAGGSPGHQHPGKSDPRYILLGTTVPEPPSLLLQETLNPTSPIHLQPPMMD